MKKSSGSQSNQPLSPSPADNFTGISETQLEYHSASVEESLNLARVMGAQALTGDILTLEGGLGAGKTLFSRGFAEGMGIQEPVTSPTFPIIQEYDHTPPLYHMDLYRLMDSGDVIETGAQELWLGPGITLIEWPDRAADILPSEIIRIDIAVEGAESRRIRISATAQRIEQLANALNATIPRA